MKPIIINSVPYSFPNGATEYCSFVSRILKCPLYIIPDGGSKPYFVEEPYSVLYDGETDFSEFDLTIMGSNYVDYYAPEYMRIVDKLPKPIVCLIHERLDIINSGYGHFWSKFLPYVSGFVTNMTNESLWMEDNNHKYVQLTVPYIPFELDSSIQRTNSILSLGRLIPSKGHRQVTHLAEIGYDVVIAGQAINYQEYALYYKKLIESGARVFKNPTTEEINKLTQQCKIFMSYLFMPDGETSVSYSALRAINGGCIPIIPDSMRKYFDELGVKALYNQDPLSAIDNIGQIFNESFTKLWRDKNLLSLNYIAYNWKEKFIKFAESVK